MYIVVEGEDPGFDIFVNGRFLARHEDALERLALRLGVRPLYFARRPGEAETHLSDLKDRLQRTGPAVFAIASAVVGVCLIVDGIIGLVKS